MPTQYQVEQTAEIIRSGGVIAYATEAVYGLGCDPMNSEAVFRILAMKQRPVEKGLILIASQIEQLHTYLGELSSEEKNVMQSVWPGPITLILSASENAPDWITGGRNSIAVRVTAHDDVRRLCDELRHPLVSTSANLAGEDPIKTESEIVTTFAEKLDAIYPSTIGASAKPTTIIDARSGVQLR